MMDIRSGKDYPSRALSNFAGHRFALDGVECHSMEGWLQSLKFKNPDMQVEVCKLVGFAAKRKGKGKNWWRDGKLYWRGQEIDRFSDDYQALLDRAYEAMFDQCEGFRKALAASAGATLTHSIGRRDPKQTILTVAEFCGRLTRLRARLQDK